MLGEFLRGMQVPRRSLTGVPLRPERRRKVSGDIRLHLRPHICSRGEVWSSYCYVDWSSRSRLQYPSYGSQRLKFKFEPNDAVLLLGLGGVTTTTVGTTAGIIKRINDRCPGCRLKRQLDNYDPLLQQCNSKVPDVAESSTIMVLR